VLDEVVRERAELQLIHTVQDVRHFLEAMLKLKAKLEPLPPGPEELQQVLPQPQHVDAHNLVVVLRLKLHGNLIVCPHL